MTSGGHGLSSVLLKSWHLTSGRLVAVSSLRLASASLKGLKSEAQRLSIHYSRRNRRIDLYCNTCHCLLYRIISELVSLGHESTLPLRIKTPILTAHAVNQTRLVDTPGVEQLKFCGKKTKLRQLSFWALVLAKSSPSKHLKWILINEANRSIVFADVYKCLKMSTIEFCSPWNLHSHTTFVLKLRSQQCSERHAEQCSKQRSVLALILADTWWY